MRALPSVNLRKISAVVLLGLTFSSSLLVPTQAKSNNEIYISQINEPFVSRNNTTITGSIVSSEAGSLYTVWSEYGVNEVTPYFSKSTDYGQTWSEQLAISTKTDPIHNDIAVCNDLLVTTYTIPHYLIASFSTDDGASWGDDAAISESNYNSFMAVTLDSYQNEQGECMFYFSWIEREVGSNFAPEDSSLALNFRMYNVDRQSWSATHRIGYLSETTMSIYDVNLQSTVDSTGEMHIIYRDNYYVTQRLFYVQSEAVQNNDWTTPVQVFAGYGADLRLASIASGTLAYAGGVEKVFISSPINNHDEIGIIAKGIDATSWSSPATVSQSGTEATRQPVMAVTDEGVLYTAWQQGMEAGPVDLVRSVSLDGVTWATPIWLDKFSNQDGTYAGHMQMTGAGQGYAMVYHRKNNFFSASEPFDY